MRVDDVDVLRETLGKKADGSAKEHAEVLNTIAKDPAVDERIQTLTGLMAALIVTGLPSLVGLRGLLLTGIGIGADYAEAKLANKPSEPSETLVGSIFDGDAYNRDLIQEIMNTQGGSPETGFGNMAAQESLQAALARSPGKRGLLDHICGLQTEVAPTWGLVAVRRADDEPSPYDNGEITYAITRAELRQILNSMLRLGIHVGREYERRRRDGASASTSAAV